jgi:hypothetical protein|tara:strand:+ start:8463 stop:9311 length:849 start_codon:yes stop_codon:yes gene_type:complete
MKALYQHVLLNSFYLWFDNFLTKKGSAYKNYRTDLYHYTDERVQNKVVFGSPYKQWVYDKNITDAVVNPLISGDSGAIAEGTSGLTFDFDNGRVLFDSDFNTGNNISGNFTVKDFNVYIANQTEETMITEGKYKTNSRYGRTLTYVPPYDQATPAAFLSLGATTNEPFAFGGIDNTITDITAVIFAENIYQLDGALSVMADSAESVFGNIPFTGSPLTEYGDVKSEYSTGYDYANVASDGDYYMINKVNVSKVSDSSNKTIPVDLFVGFVDFEVYKYRMPRS